MLQLYISQSHRGFKSVRNINPAESVQRHIYDVRRVLEQLDYNAAEKHLFYLIKYIDEGSFFTILRTIPDQSADHLATTIFVPNGLKITKEELHDVVRRTTRIISNSSVSAEDMAELRSLFSREYPIAGDAPAMVESYGREFAHIFYGDGTGHALIDFLGESLYQPAFLKYEGVLLIDAELGVTATGDDLTDFRLQQTVTLFPPKENNSGFMPHIYRRQFTQPFLVPLGDKVSIVWRRGGFEEQDQEIVVDRDGMEIPVIATSESRKSITPASFYVTSQSTHAQIHSAVITVNGIEITSAHHFTQDELKNAEVIVRAQGYGTFHQKLDLAATTQALIQLPEQRKIYRFELPVKSSELGAPIHFEIHTKRDIADSPLEGYELNDGIQEGVTRVNHLRYVGGTPLISRRMIGYAAGVFIVGFLLGWLLMGGCGGKKAEQTAADTTAVAAEAPAAAPSTQSSQSTPTAQTTSTTPAQPAATPTPAPTATGKASKEAVNYLDNNKQWKRDQLEKIADLRGLFDDLNHFRYERIKTYWAPRLEGSRSFAKVVTAVTEGSRKKIFTPGASDTYCPANDNTISWVPYTYKVDPSK